MLVVCVCVTLGLCVTDGVMDCDGEAVLLVVCVCVDDGEDDCDLVAVELQV